MKKGIHPEYKPAKISCVCGNVVETRSTKGDYEIQICAKCHPFFTGKQKFVDTAGRVERFQRRYAKFDAQRQAARAKPEAEAAPSPEPAPAEEPKQTAAAEPAPTESAESTDTPAEKTET